jgi:RHS repeat-associated protein
MNGVRGMNGVRVKPHYGAGAIESLDYDGLHRLTKSTRTIGTNAPVIVDYSYDENGNITGKSDQAAVYAYSAGQPNRLEETRNSSGTVLASFGYDLNGNLKANGSQTLDYNAFNKPVRIQEGTAGPETLFTYGANALRYRQINPAGATVYYIDQLMEIEMAGTEANYRHYLSDVAILTKTGDLNDPNPGIDYLHRDRLGSIVNITDVTGVIEEGRGFDAFGKPRNGDWSDKVPATLNSGITDRGFTEHEHLDTHALIHMNGRGYDYGLGRFLSIDPIVQSPGNSQSWNPYSYIMNNPLSGTDPTGYASTGTGSRIDGGVIGNCSGCQSSTRLRKMTKTTKREDGTKVVATVQQTGDGADFSATSYRSNGSVSESVTGSVSNGVEAGPSSINSQQQTTGSNVSTGGGDSGDNSQTDGPKSFTNFVYDRYGNFVDYQDSHGAIVVDMFGLPTQQEGKSRNHFADAFLNTISAFGVFGSTSKTTFGVTPVTREFRYYTSGWAGGGRGSMRTYSVSSSARVAGAVAVPLTIYGEVERYKSGEISGSHLGFNIGVAGASAYIAAFGPYGWAYLATDPYNQEIGAQMFRFAMFISPNIEIAPPRR